MAYKVIEETSGGDRREWRVANRERAKKLYDFVLSQYPKGGHKIHHTLHIEPTNDARRRRTRARTGLLGLNFSKPVRFG